jgi:hypothetical protein
MYLLFILLANAFLLPPILTRCLSRRLPSDITYTDHIHVALCLLTAPRDSIEQHDRLRFALSMGILNLALIAIRLIYTAVV